MRRFTALIGVAIAGMLAIGAGGATAAQAAVVGHWKMDETAGTTVFDSSGRGHNGTRHGTITIGGGSYLFTKGYVDVPNATDLNANNATVAMSIRLNTTKTPASPDWDLIRKGLYTTTGGEYKMEWQPNGKVSCGFKGSNGYAEDANGAGPAINTGVWHTATCIKTSTYVQEQIDGVPVWTKNVALGSIAPQANVVIGSRPGSEYFQGSLADAQLAIG